MSLDTYIDTFWIPVIAVSLGILIYSTILTVKSWRWKYTYLHTLATVIDRDVVLRTIDVSFSAPKLGHRAIITADDAEQPSMHATVRVSQLRWDRTLKSGVIEIMYPPGKPEKAVHERSSLALAMSLLVVSFLVLTYNVLLLLAVGSVGALMVRD